MTAKNKSKALRKARKKAVKKARFSDKLKKSYDVRVNNRKGKIVVREKN